MVRCKRWARNQNWSEIKILNQWSRCTSAFPAIVPLSDGLFFIDFTSQENIPSIHLEGLVRHLVYCRIKCFPSGWRKIRRLRFQRIVMRNKGYKRVAVPKSEIDSMFDVRSVLDRPSDILRAIDNRQASQDCSGSGGKEKKLEEGCSALPYIIVVFRRTASTGNLRGRSISKKQLNSVVWPEKAERWNRLLRE